MTVVVEEFAALPNPLCRWEYVAGAALLESKSRLVHTKILYHRKPRGYSAPSPVSHSQEVVNSRVDFH